MFLAEIRAYHERGSISLTSGIKFGREFTSMHRHESCNRSSVSSSENDNENRKCGQMNETGKPQKYLALLRSSIASISRN